MTTVCENCRFWVLQPSEYSNDPVEGKCKKLPPSPVTLPADYEPQPVTIYWPTTQATDFCGGFSAGLNGGRG